MKVHVHVYKVEAKAEIELDAETVEQAQELALDQVKSHCVPFGESDCKYIAIPFKIVSDRKKSLFGRKIQAF